MADIPDIPDIQISDLPGRTTPAGTDLMHVEASGADYKAELSALVNAVTDAAPTEDSPAPVSSGGMFDALAGKQDALTFDDAPVENSNNPVKSGGVFDALAGKQDVLTFDNVPTANSNNPVKSGGVFDALAGKQNTLTKEYIVNNGDTLSGGGKYDLIKYGRVMELIIRNLTYAQSVGNITPVIIPEQYRPASNIRGVGNYGMGSLSSSTLVLFELFGSNGNVRSYTYSAFEGNNYNNLHMVWLI